MEDARRAATLGPGPRLGLRADRGAPPPRRGDRRSASSSAQGRSQLPEDTAVVEMVDGATAVLAGSGLDRYEISSYARPGKHSRHNALYWTGGESLALGAGAVGFRRTGERRALRTTALRSTPKWMAAVESGVLPDAEREELGPAELYAERLLLGLRLRNGLDLPALWAASGVPSRNAVVQAMVARWLPRAVRGPGPADRPRSAPARGGHRAAALTPGPATSSCNARARPVRRSASLSDTVPAAGGTNRAWYNRTFRCRRRTPEARPRALRSGAQRASRSDPGRHLRLLAEDSQRLHGPARGALG